MIVSKKSLEVLSEYVEILFLKVLNFIKNELFLVKKWEIEVIISMILLTRSSERILNSDRYTVTYKCYAWCISLESVNWVFRLKQIQCIILYRISYIYFRISYIYIIYRVYLHFWPDWKKLHRLVKRLAALNIMGAWLNAPWSSSVP